MPRVRTGPYGPRSSAGGAGTHSQTKVKAPKSSSGSHGGKMHHRLNKGTKGKYK